MLKRTYILVLLVLATSLQLAGQELITNGSMNGTPGYAKVPAGWLSTSASVDIIDPTSNNPLPDNVVFGCTFADGALDLGPSSDGETADSTQDYAIVMTNPLTATSIDVMNTPTLTIISKEIYEHQYKSNVPAMHIIRLKSLNPTISIRSIPETKEGLSQMTFPDSPSMQAYYLYSGSCLIVEINKK